MANIKIALDYTIVDGQPLSFKAPCNCTAVTGIKVEYPNGDSTTSKVFSFADAHGTVLTGIGNLFAAGAMVRVLLDTVSKKAYIQNADTNAYLEAQLASKAPAGYGLGTLSPGPTNDDINACVKNGWMSVYADTLNVPAGFEYSTAHVSTRAGNTYGIVQVLTGILTNKGCQMIRVSTDNGLTWTDEWVNPPLLDDKEYRTTERFLGKPVYAKRLNFGIGVTGGKAVDITKDTIDCLVRVEGCWVNGDTKELFTSEYIVTGVSVDRYDGASRLKVETNEVATNYTGYPVVYYTKS